MPAFEVCHGSSPVILGLPHTGTEVPPEVWARLNENGRVLADTDWHVHTLYDGLLPGATTVRATFHRYVIDANRDPTGGALYARQSTASLVPLTDFDGRPIWLAGQAPAPGEIADRIAMFHAPYHAALEAEVERVRAIHGIAVVYDCHSIRSHAPFLFDGRLPDLNIGTNEGTTCSPYIERAAMEIVHTATDYTHVLNGRFKGGWTTRHYGRPAGGVHAIQMELAQSTHLTAEAPRFTYDPAKANRLRAVLKILLERIESVALKMA